MARKLVHAAAKVANLKKKAEGYITELWKSAQKPALFQGHTRKYEPYQSTDSAGVVDRAATVPDEVQLVQLRAREVLAQAQAAWSELIDATYQQDVGNMTATADVTVDGNVLLKDVPVTNLMFLLKRVEYIHSLVQQLPIPDPAVDWKWDGTQGLLVSAAEQVTQKTAKVTTVIKKFDPTEHHPGQADVVYSDKPIGEFKHRKLSGAITQPEKMKILERLAKLIVALREARQTANTSVDITDDGIADQLFGYAFGPLNAAAQDKTA